MPKKPSQTRPQPAASLNAGLWSPNSVQKGGGPASIQALLKDIYAKSSDPIGASFQIPIVLPKPIARIMIPAGSLNPSHPGIYYAGDLRIEVRPAYSSGGLDCEISIYQEPDNANQARPKAQWEGPPPHPDCRYAQTLLMRLPDVPTPPDDAGP